MRKYDICFIPFPYEEDEEKYKVRPVVILSNNEGIILTSKITSQTKYKGKFDYQIKELDSTGLYKPSIIRLNKRVLFDEKDVIKNIGHLSNEDIKGVEDILKINKVENINESKHYGGAYDIADDQYFTRDDINEFAYELEEALDDGFHDVEYVSAYIENGEIEVTLRFRDYEETVIKKIDMRKIKSPKDLMNKYMDVFYNEFFELFEDDRELDNRSTLERGFYD